MTFILPILDMLLKQKNASTSRVIEFAWAIRRAVDAQWVKDELEVLFVLVKSIPHARICFLITRNDGLVSNQLKDESLTDGVLDNEISTTDKTLPTINISTANSSLTTASLSSIMSASNRPGLSRVLDDFISSAVEGRTCVVCSGPTEMLTGIRGVVGARNSAHRVWREDDRLNVEMMRMIGWGGRE